MNRGAKQVTIITEREARLRQLAEQMAELAEKEFQLIEIIKHTRAHLDALPGIIRGLETERESLASAASRIGAEWDALNEELPADTYGSAAMRLAACQDPTGKDANEEYSRFAAWHGGNL